jgi:hypothetical protein
MITTLALRSLLAHPVRSAVLAAGFGLGVAVMAILLGVGRVVLEQARSPQLVGGGDVLITGASGDITAARALLAGALARPPLADRVRVASPWSRSTVYLMPSGSRTTPVPIRARGGIPSLERAIGDRETSDAQWRDTPADAAWVSPDPGEVLRAIDRFHPIPDVPARAASWAEWLYFNGRTASARFYLTFLVGPRGGDGRRTAGVRLQLDRGRGVESFGAQASLDEDAVSNAPDLTIGSSAVRLDGLRYRLRLDLVDRAGRRAIGDVSIAGSAAALLPPIEIHGAAGWRTGYVVPVMSGPLTGSIRVGHDRIDLDGGIGYHDHNWGFWEGVSWQWGQVQHGDISLVFGRVFPPPDAADATRMPGFLGVLGPDGPIGHATSATIEETSDAAGRPQGLTIRGRSGSIDLTATFSVESTEVNRMQGGPLATGLDFLQMRGRYNVSGEAGGETLQFTAPGAAETFRGERNTGRGPRP